MKTIHKYAVEVQQYQEIETHLESDYLTAQVQDGKIVLWMLVNTCSKKIKRTIVFCGTGQEAILSSKNYVATVQFEGYVWHIFAFINAVANA